MKKIFTFTLAILATMSLWADEPTHTNPATVTYGGKTFIDAGNTPGNAAEEAYINYGVMDIDKNKATYTWIVAVNWSKSNNSFSIPTDAVGFCKPGSSAKDDFYGNVNFSTSKTTKIEVFFTGCEEIGWIWQNSGSTNYITYTLSEIDSEGNATGTPQTTTGVDPISNAMQYAKFSDLSSSKYYCMTMTATGGSNSKFYGFTLKRATCKSPENLLVLKASKTVDVVAGEEITFSTEGGNGAAVKYYEGESEVSNPWPAVKGEHTFVAKQVKNGDYCAQEADLKITVIGTDPVISATITGPNTVKVGKEVTLTCEAAEATSFQWYKDGTKIDGATSETYAFTPTAAGEVVFACEAWNKNNDETHPAAKSGNFNVKVNEDDCGLLAKVSTTSKNTGKLEDGAVFSGTVSVSSDGKNEAYEGLTGYKLSGQGSHVGITFTDGTLKKKDKVIVFVTKVSDGKKLQIFSDKGTTLIAETDNLQLGENIFVLDDRAEGKDGLYVYRQLGGDEGAQYNAYIAYVKLQRPCGDESSEATFSSLTINGQEVTGESGVYSIELPAETTEEQIEIKFELAAGATADKTSPMQILVPKPGETVEKTITVTSESGENTVTYTIKISRAAAPKSTDASIKQLKINNTVVMEVNTAFAYEVMADVALDSVEVTFELADKATADKTDPFKMLVPEPGAAATETVIKVTAEDGTTTKDYTVKVLKAKKAEEALDNVQSDNVHGTKVIENGVLYLMYKGTKYNVQGKAIEIKN